MSEQEAVSVKSWPLRTIADITRTTSGSTPSRGRSDYYGGSIPWVKTGELRDGYITDTEEYITEQALAENSLSLLPIGTLLIAMYGQGQTRGRTGILKLPASTNQACFAILPNEEMFVPEYLQFWFRHNYERLRHETEARGGNQPNLNGQILKSLCVPIPPLAEQKRLVVLLNEHLTSTNRARAAATAQLEAAGDLPDAYLSHVFLKNQNALPVSWKWRLLGDICDITAKQIDPKLSEYASMPHVNGENIESGTGRLLNVRSAGEDNMTSGKYIFEPGSVLYSKLRPYLRKVTVVYFAGLCSADMYPIEVDAESLDPHFLMWLLLSDSFTQHADTESRRARMPKLNREQLFAYRAPIPPLDEQKIIAGRLQREFAASNDLREEIRSQLSAIDNLPSAILRQAFHGEL